MTVPEYRPETYQDLPDINTQPSAEKLATTLALPSQEQTANLEASAPKQREYQTDEIEEMYREQAPLFLGLARKVLWRYAIPDVDLGHDAVQTAFHDVQKRYLGKGGKMQPLEKDGNLFALTYTITIRKATNIAVKWHKKNSRSVPLIDDEGPVPWPELIIQEDTGINLRFDQLAYRAIINKLASELAPIDMTLLRIAASKSEADDLTRPDIAYLLRNGRNGAFRTATHRAKARARKILEEMIRVPAGSLKGSSVQSFFDRLEEVDSRKRLRP